MINLAADVSEKADWQPCEAFALYSHRPWSPWEMASLVSIFVLLSRTFASTEATLKGRRASDTLENPPNATALQKLKEGMPPRLRSVLPATTPHLRRVIDMMLGSALTVGDFQEATRELQHRFEDDINELEFVLIIKKNFYKQDKLFGPDVFGKLSSANEDIAEAGTCFALERYTACVMHLMRVVEVGLAVLAATLGISKQNDWGRYLAR